jgi:DnaK suppressor protein
VKIVIVFSVLSLRQNKGWRGPKGFTMPKTMNKNGAKTKFEPYQKALESKSEELRRSMSAQKIAQVVSRLDVPSDEGDLSQQSHEEWIFLNRNTLDMKLLRDIQAALRRIEQSTYGVCAACEEPISAKRLDAVPWAKFCVRCQEKIGAETAEFDDDDFDSAR